MKMLPLDYAARNAMRSPARLLQIIIGSAIVVLLVSFAAAFGAGIEDSMQHTGDSRNVIILGSGSEESIERSEVSAAAEDIVAASIKGFESHMNIPAVSGEVYYNGLVQRGEQEFQSVLRGVTERSLLVHQRVRLIAGNWPGPNEVLAGAQAHLHQRNAATAYEIGETLTFEDETWRVSGIFVAAGSLLESELWLPRQDLMTATQRDSLSCVIVRCDTATFSDVSYFTSTRLDLELSAIPANEYYAQLAHFYQPVIIMAWATALLIAAGAVLGGINTLYAAFAARLRELATLQAIGFSRPVVFLSLLQESLMTVLAGTVLALSIGLLGFDGWMISFSSGVFKLTWSADILLFGLLCGLSLGVLGCIAPAIRCLSPPLTSTLRGLA